MPFAPGGMARTGWQNDVLNYLRVVDTDLFMKLGAVGSVVRDVSAQSKAVVGQVDAVDSSVSRAIGSKNPVDAVSAFKEIGRTLLSVGPVKAFIDGLRNDNRYTPSKPFMQQAPRETSQPLLDWNVYTPSKPFMQQAPRETSQPLLDWNVYTPDVPLSDGQASSVGDAFREHRNDFAIEKHDISQVFVQDRATMGRPWKPASRTRINVAASGIDDVYSTSADVGGLDKDGVVFSKTQLASADTDATAILPLSFTDLRGTSSGYRSVYVRPFNMQVSEQFAPDYEQAQFYGRTDPVAFYKATTRTVSLSFELHAFAPQDLYTIFKKVHWLTSMVYPEYTVDALIKRGPVVRLRVGDLIKSGYGGLAGVITSLELDYNEALWELEQGSVVPRKVGVSVGFMALHDGSVGVVNGRFGVFSPQKMLQIDETARNSGGASVDDAFKLDGFRGFGELHPSMIKR
jgi:hypothetical protein